MSVIMLTKDDAAFRGISFVRETIGKKDIRRYVNTILVDGDGRAISTNGHCLHMAADTLIQPGVYGVEGTKSRIILIPVDPAKVTWPPVEALDRAANIQGETYLYKREPTKEFGGLLYVVSNLGPFMNYKYVQRLEEFDNEWSVIVVDSGDMSRPVLFRSGPLTAVIAPINGTPKFEDQP